MTEALVHDAQREGSLRPDVAGGDVTHLFTLLLQSANRSSRQRDDIVFERARAVLLDGLRARPGDAQSATALPGRPLSIAGLDGD